ncbi:conserved Plasmodium protein, unknown function [Plasmodium malariae]|uniref:MORN repeat protein n=1 Tax=Plasmodium malariae TaxID=5858 RepID=A0A1C3KAQ8_PLAMA|nr:conserved Plasmodium protein, unknown function [Plasmodium malariae]
MAEDVNRKNQLEHEGLDKNYTGEAKVKYKNGDKFIGTFDNGKKCKGKYYYSNKSTYEGFYLNEKKNGLGKLTKNELEFYYGNFENGKKKGVGFQRYPNGDFYYGEWTNNRKNGKGIYFFFSTKEYYFGEWSKGSFTNGDWVLSHEVKYVGSFFKDKPNFKGFFLFSNEAKINIFFEQLFTIAMSENEESKERVELLWRNI